jgi:hypothetical protein
MVLVELEVPMKRALESLSKNPSDPLGEPVLLRKENVAKAASEFFEGRNSGSDLTARAGRLEM